MDLIFKLTYQLLPNKTNLKNKSYVETQPNLEREMARAAKRSRQTRLLRHRI